MAITPMIFFNVLFSNKHTRGSSLRYKLSWQKCSKGCISTDQNYAVQSILISTTCKVHEKKKEFMLEKKMVTTFSCLSGFFTSLCAETAWVHILEPRETKGLDRYSSFENQMAIVERKFQIPSHNSRTLLPFLHCHIDFT